jgi:hypothetical protein
MPKARLVKRLLSIAEACDELGLSRPTLHTDMKDAGLLDGDKEVKTKRGPTGHRVICLDDEDLEKIRAHRKAKREKDKRVKA